MTYRRSDEPKGSEITPESIWTDRRQVVKTLLAGSAVSLAAPSFAAGSPTGRILEAKRNAAYVADEPLNSWDDITTYNNFYEFGTDKSDPARNAGTLRPSPWSVTVGGEAELRGTFSLDDLLKPHALEERVYRFRCVEAWSMVIPWVGFPLADLIKRFKPTSKAKFVAFTTLRDPVQMPGQRSAVLDWPYVEGLRMDEAVHPLAFMAVGVYGRALPNQSGAPLRLVVPWKYGFKNVKSIVRIDFVEHAPTTTWAAANPREYGFFANVNPAVDHPRWSQKTERRIGSGVFAPRIATRPFNGYTEVASLYSGLDLSKWI
jgi:sulfoxide reductase catalytic subunit YedY